MNTDKITSFVQRHGYGLLGLFFCLILIGQFAVGLSPSGAVKQPDDVPEEIHDVKVALQSHDYVLARRLAEDYIEGNPGVAEGYFLLAHSEFQVGNFLVAVEKALKAAELDPSSISYRVFLADLYKLIGWLEKAEEQITLAVELDPEDLQLLGKRQELLQLLGRPKEALEDLDYGISISNGDLDLLLRRADLLWRINEIERAKEDLAYVMASGNEEKIKIAREIRRNFEQR